MSTEAECESAARQDFGPAISKGDFGPILVHKLANNMSVPSMDAPALKAPQLNFEGNTMHSTDGIMLQTIRSKIDKVHSYSESKEEADAPHAIDVPPSVAVVKVDETNVGRICYPNMQEAEEPSGFAEPPGTLVPVSVNSAIVKNYTLNVDASVGNIATIQGVSTNKQTLWLPTILATGTAPNLDTKPRGEDRSPTGTPQIIITSENYVSNNLSQAGVRRANIVPDPNYISRSKSSKVQILSNISLPKTSNVATYTGQQYVTPPNDPVESSLYGSPNHIYKLSASVTNVNPKHLNHTANSKHNKNQTMASHPNISSAIISQGQIKSVAYTHTFAKGTPKSMNKVNNGANLNAAAAGPPANSQCHILSRVVSGPKLAVQPGRKNVNTFGNKGATKNVSQNAGQKQSSKSIKIIQQTSSMHKSDMKNWTVANVNSSKSGSNYGIVESGNMKNVTTQKGSPTHKGSHVTPQKLNAKGEQRLMLQSPCGPVLISTAPISVSQHRAPHYVQSGQTPNLRYIQNYSAPPENPTVSQISANQHLTAQILQSLSQPKLMLQANQPLANHQMSTTSMYESELFVPPPKPVDQRRHIYGDPSTLLTADDLVGMEERPNLSEEINRYSHDSLAFVMMDHTYALSAQKNPTITTSSAPNIVSAPVTVSPAPVATPPSPVKSVPVVTSTVQLNDYPSLPISTVPVTPTLPLTSALLGNLTYMPTEPYKPLSESYKPLPESYKPLSESYKPSSESYNSSSESYKPSSESYKPSSESYKPLSEPYKPLSESYKLSSDPYKLSSEPYKMNIITEHYKLLAEPYKPSTEPYKLSSESYKLSSESYKLSMESYKLAESYKLSEPYKLPSESYKPKPEDDDAGSAISSLDGRPADRAGSDTETAPENEEEGKTRCICDFTHDDGYMICCDRCGEWQHVDCMGIDRNNIPEAYMCDLCQPRPVDRRRARNIQLRKREELSALVASDSDSSDGGLHSLGSRRKRLLTVTTYSDTSGACVTTYNNALPAQLPTVATPAAKKLTKRPQKRTDMGKKVTKRKLTEKRVKRKKDLMMSRRISNSSSNQSHWHEAYEQAMTNHYSPELRAKIIKYSSKCNTPNMTSAITAHYCTTVPHAGGKILIATKDLKENLPIIELRGKYMLSNQHRPQVQMSGRSGGQKPGPYVFFYRLPRDNTQICIDTRTYGNEARFVRRSCKSNAELQHCIVKGTLHVYLVSVGSIPADTEITVAHDVNSAKQPCACGNPKHCKLNGINASSRKSTEYMREKRSSRNRRSSSQSSCPGSPPPVNNVPVLRDLPPRLLSTEKDDLKSPVKSEVSELGSPLKTWSSPVYNEEPIKTEIKEEKLESCENIPLPEHFKSEDTVDSAMEPVKQEIKSETPEIEPPTEEPMKAEVIPELIEEPVAEEPEEIPIKEEAVTQVETEKMVVPEEAPSKVKEEEKPVRARAACHERSTRSSKTSSIHNVDSLDDKTDDSQDKLPASTGSTKDKSKMTREERKMEAIMRAIERMEKAEQRKQEVRERQSKRRESDPVQPSIDMDDEENITLAAAKKRKKRKGRARTTSQNASRRRLNSADSDMMTSGDEPHTSSPKDEADMHPEPRRPSPTPTALHHTTYQHHQPSEDVGLSSACMLVDAAVGTLENAFKLPKTKKTMANEWVGRSPDRTPSPYTSPYRPPLLPSLESLVRVASTMIGDLSGATSEPDEGQSPPRTPNKKKIKRTNKTVAPVAELQAPIAPAQHSAKKRWLRQAISEESDSPTAESPPNEMVTPLKKRRMARESLSCEPPAPETCKTEENSPNITAENSPVKEEGRESITQHCKVKSRFIESMYSEAACEDHSMESKYDPSNLYLHSLNLNTPRDEKFNMDIRRIIGVPGSEDIPDDIPKLVEEKSTKPMDVNDNEFQELRPADEDKAKETPMEIDMEISPHKIINDTSDDIIVERIDCQQDVKVDSTETSGNSSPQRDEMDDIQKKIHSFHTENIQILKIRNKKPAKEKRKKVNLNFDLNMVDDQISVQLRTESENSTENNGDIEDGGNNIVCPPPESIPLPPIESIPLPASPLPPESQFPHDIPLPEIPLPSEPMPSKEKVTTQIATFTEAIMSPETSQSEKISKPIIATFTEEITPEMSKLERVTTPVATFTEFTGTQVEKNEEAAKTPVATFTETDKCSHTTTPEPVQTPNSPYIESSTFSVPTLEPHKSPKLSTEPMETPIASFDDSSKEMSLEKSTLKSITDDNNLTFSSRFGSSGLFSGFFNTLNSNVDSSINENLPNLIKTNLETSFNKNSTLSPKDELKNVQEILSRINSIDANSSVLFSGVLKNSDQDNKPDLQPSSPVKSGGTRSTDPRLNPPPLDNPKPVRRKLSISEYRKRHKPSGGGSTESSAERASSEGRRQGRLCSVDGEARADWSSDSSAAASLSPLRLDAAAAAAADELDSRLHQAPRAPSAAAALRAGVAGVFDAQPTQLERQRENLSERLRREFGLTLPEDEEARSATALQEPVHSVEVSVSEQTMCESVPPFMRPPAPPKLPPAAPSATRLDR